MNISAESLSDASRESDDAATEAARRINWMNTSETTAVASANAAMAGKEPRRFQIADSNNSAIQIVVDAANHAVTGWMRMTLKPHPIMMIATAKVTRPSQRAEFSILVAPVLPL